MADPNSIINLGELSKPATVLIEKISDAIGGVFKPYQIRRVAEAEAGAEKIKAVANIEITELQQRALQRFLIEETNKQNNMENIIRKSLPALDAEANPGNIENDWITDFFDKSRLVSDEEMQELWARILAGEGNSPGSFSKRTLNLISSLSKEDAQLFSKFSSFVWNIGVENEALIYDHQANIYNRSGINFSTLKHLDSMGLISFESLTGYRFTGLNKIYQISYQGSSLTLEFPNDKDNEMKTGHVLLTNAGRELMSICIPEKINGFVEYCLEKFTEQGIKQLVSGQQTEVPNITSAETPQNPL